MTDDEFLERLRGPARSLRYEGDPFLPARLRASMSARIGSGGGIAEILYRWRRRIAVTLLAVSLAAGAGLFISTPPLTTETIAALADAGMMREDIYSAAAE